MSNNQTEHDKRQLKEAVRQHWEGEPCNTRYSDAMDRRTYFTELEEARYRLEPNIPNLARFSDGRGKKVLEIGIGYGVDFLNWVRAGADAVGLDFTQASVDLTREHLDCLGADRHRYHLIRGDAENLPLHSDSFDIVYAYGSLHHTPDTERAFAEACRVLKPGGELRAMIYHSPSWTAINLWLYHALFKLRPWLTLKDVVFRYLESPGTKVYSKQEATDLVRRAGLVPQRVSTVLDTGDLMSFKLGVRYAKNPVVRLARALYPRPIIRLLGHGLGHTLEIVATRPL